MRVGNGSGSFLTMMRLNKIAHDRASIGDNRVSHHPPVKAGKGPLDLPIIRMITFMIIFAVSFSLLIPGGLFNHQIALADTGNMAVDNASTSYTPERAPLNPAFVAYVNSKSGLQAMSLSASSPVLGLIPAPLDLSGLTGEQIDTPGSFSVYSSSGSFDLRTQNKVTPVRNQGSSGSCWAFAAYGSMESYLLPGETWDFSENNLKNNAGFDMGPNNGGNYEMAMAYLTRWSGPVNESDDPFNALSTTSPTNKTVQKHVQNAYIIPDRSNVTDNDNIKLALTTYGAVFTSMYWSDSHYNSAHYTYYDSTDESSKGISNNHAVTIVGWNDSYSASNFSPAAPGNGAFIIKNSWGTSWGESGYFYVSYYDRNVGINNVVFTADPVTNYDHIYQYDPLGWVTSFSLDGSNTAWFANDFTAGSKENITAVGFYTAALNSPYTVEILENGNVQEINSGTLPMAGYNTVVLNSPVTANPGTKFRVAVHLTTPGYNLPIPIEYPQSSYSSKATSNASESFVGTSLSNMVDVRNYYTNGDVCLKAYTDDYTTGPGMLQFNQSGYSVYENKGIAQITVNRVGGAVGTVTVNYATNGGSATPGTDYTPVSGTLKFNDSETSKSFNVQVFDDGAYGSDKIVFLNLTSPTGGATTGVNAATLTIKEADGIPTVQFNTSIYKVYENCSIVSTNVTLNGTATSNITINYATASGTATSGSDFTATSGTLTFKPGDHSKIINISIINDSIYEPDQNFTITLSSPSSNVIVGAPGSATITIKDDDTAPSIRFQSLKYNVSEGGAIATINVTLSALSEVPIGVSYSTSNGSALAGINYTQTSGVLQFATGVTVASFNVPIIDNYLINGSSSFNVSLSNPTGGATLGAPSVAAVNISYDDQAGSYTFNLTSGWNLISIPLNIQDKSIQNIFPDNVKSDLVDVWGWDENTQNFEFYCPDQNDWYYSQYPALTNLETSRGYWVEMNRSVSFTIQGMIPLTEPNSPIQLKSGWNMVGLTGFATSDIKSMYPGAIDVWSWDENTQNFEFYCPDQNDWYYSQYPALTNLETGRGYWVEMP